MTEPAGLYATKSDYAYTRLRDGILSGEFEPGTVLHQATLAKTIGISTTPLREAMRRLMTEGLVELDAHRDARVSALTAEEARDLLEVRRSLDPLAAALAAERRTKDDIRSMREAAASRCTLLPNDSSMVDLVAHRRFHTAIYVASHNDLLISTLDALWDKADRYRRAGAPGQAQPGGTRPEGRASTPGCSRRLSAATAKAPPRSCASTSTPAWAPRPRADSVPTRQRPATPVCPDLARPRRQRCAGPRSDAHGWCRSTANTLLVQAITFVLRPTAIYRAIELDVPAQWLGALGASFAIVPLVLAVPSGPRRRPLRRTTRHARGLGAHGHRRRRMFVTARRRRRGDSCWPASRWASVTCARWSANKRWSPTAPPRALRHRVRALHVRRLGWAGRSAPASSWSSAAAAPSPTPTRSSPGPWA